MKVTSVTTSLSLTIPTEQYGNIKPEASVTVELEPKDTPYAALELANEEVLHALALQIHTVLHGQIRELQDREVHDFILENMTLYRWLKRLNPDLADLIKDMADKPA